MEDHKRKNKKRNQNKRPTADQIKKLQNTVEQKKDMNGDSEEKGNGTSAEVYEDSHRTELKVDNHEVVESYGNKKNKKKNKQQKFKQGENENIPQNENGYLDQKAGHNHTNSNGITHEVNKDDDYSQLKTKSPSVNSETVVAALETLTFQTNERHVCSSPSSGTTSSCHQYHGEEAPTCSHHIQHNVDNRNIGDFKIEFDFQKHLSPMSSPMGSNKEYFYKGFNIEQVKVEGTENNSENKESKSSEKIVQNIQPMPFEPNDQTPFGIDGSKSRGSEPLENPQVHFDPTALLKSVLANEQHQAEPIQLADIMKSMFESQGGQTFNPEDRLKSMFGGIETQTKMPLEPTAVLNSMLGKVEGSANIEMNPLDMKKNIFEHEKNQKASREALKISSTPNVSKASNEPTNPNDVLRNMFQQGGINSNPAAIFEAMLGGQVRNNISTPDPDDIPDMFSQINAMAQQMNPDIINNMSQMVANMDPSLMMGVNNMVSSMMQGNGLDLKTLMQMKAGRLQKSQAKVAECDILTEQQKLDGRKCFDQNDQDSKTVVEPIENVNTSVPNNKTSEITNDSKEAGAQEDKLSENIKSREKICKNKENIEPGMKCSFSFSSNTSEIAEESNNDTESIEEDESTDENKVEQKKVLRFVRDESIPELLENLTKTDIQKKVTTDRVEIKTSKFKTIINKVLKKEKKSVDGNIISSIEVHEHRVDYQNKKGPGTPHNKDIDFEKLQHVKEPFEVRERKEMSSKLKDINQKLSSEQNNNAKEAVKVEKVAKNSGEFNKEDIPFSESTEQMVVDDNVEFNLESMNEIFTNLLQGRKMTLETTSSPSNLDINNSNYPPSAAFHSPFETIMKQNMSSLFNNIVGQQNLNDKAVGSNEGKIDTEGREQTLNQNQINLVQNFQVMMKQFPPKNQENGETSQVSLFESMTNMFDKMITNKDESSIPDFQDFFLKQENMTEILKMGEMLFGNNFDEHPKDDSIGSENNIGQTKDREEKSMVVAHDIENEEAVEDAKIVDVSKNVHQNERPSVFFKQLLGENFWRIRNKNKVSKENTKCQLDNRNKKNKSIELADASNSETTESFVCDSSTLNKIVKPATSLETSSLPAELQLELEKESPLVRMLHKRIQKDTKLQQFLKEKLKKDPKMQKFIQERLQKDERIQKFMREKLSNDKALRQSFEERFKNELGLTDIVPKFDDEKDSNERSSVDNKEEEKRSSEKMSDGKSGTDASKVKKDNAKSTAKKIHTGILFKTYAELTCLLVAIVYAAILCY